MAKYQQMYLAYVTVDLPNAGKQTLIGVSHFEQGASGHLAEILEAHGFSPAQIGRILDRARVTNMTSRTLGCTLLMQGEVSFPFSKKV